MAYFDQYHVEYSAAPGENKIDLSDRIRGCLVGGAAGDALGYPVEFMTRKQILAQYGSNGISTFDLASNGKALVSDDTQMTLFTANGLLFGVTRLCTHGGLGAGLKDFVRYAYLDWLETQIGVTNYNDYHYCWIRDIVGLNVRRAPGNTCMSALRAIKYHEEVRNDSKGCGGVMRMAPVGLMAAADETLSRRTWAKQEIVRLAGDCAELTHKHPLGYLPAAILADLIYYILMYDGKMTFDTFVHLLHDVDRDCRNEYKQAHETQALDELWALIEKAIHLAEDIQVADEVAIPRLGEGWTGDEALAIAIYCALRHIDSFGDAIIAAVNHNGDSDSTGAICGNIMGAIVGCNGIPNRFTDQLELKDLIIDMADDLLDGCSISEYHSPSTPVEKIWERRYVMIEPACKPPIKGSYAIMDTEYPMMPQAKRMMRIKQLGEYLPLAHGPEQYKIAYKLALYIFDTNTFDPFHPLPYRHLCHEPRNYFNLKEYAPAYYYGYSDSKYSPFDSKRVFKLNHMCFPDNYPIIGYRMDGVGPVKNELQAGLRPYSDPNLSQKYPGWVFYLIDRASADGQYAVFTNTLEKEFAVEIAHLWPDGTLHRIYHLYY